MLKTKAPGKMDENVGKSDLYEAERMKKSAERLFGGILR